MINDKLISIINKFKNKNILVIGDIMLDKYINGEVSRISPEAPVQVVNVKSEKYVPGGAANVCNNLSALGARTFISGMVGKDEIGKQLFSCLNTKNINYSLVIHDSKRPTTQKVRVIGRSQQLLRIDYETAETPSPDIEKKITSKIASKIKSFDAVVVSDYAKGVVTKKLFRSLISAAKKHNIPIIVDPKPKNKEAYHEAYLIKPNLKEAIGMSGIDVRREGDNIKRDEDIIKIGAKLVRDYNSNIIITCGEKGMFIFSKDNKVKTLATNAKEVYDVTGAGDTVGAVLALAIATGANLEEAAFIANKAAGIVVGKTGTATITTNELKRVLE